MCVCIYVYIYLHISIYIKKYYKYNVGRVVTSNEGSQGSVKLLTRPRVVGRGCGSPSHPVLSLFLTHTLCLSLKHSCLLHTHTQG